MMEVEDIEQPVDVQQHESTKGVQFASFNEHVGPFEHSTRPKQDFSSDVSLSVGEPRIISCHLLLHLIDDAVDVLRSLTYITQGNLSTLTTMKNDLHPELYEILRWHADHLHAWQEADAKQSQQELVNSTKALCFFFFQNKEFAQNELEALNCVNEPSIVLLMEAFLKLRRMALKRFSTTLEEQELIDGYHKDVNSRQKAAIKANDLVSKLLEEERSKHMDEIACYEEEERIILQVGESSRDQLDRECKQLEDEFASIEAQELNTFNMEYEPLKNENEILREELTKEQFKDREKELQQRGKNGQSREELTDLMWGYEHDVKEKTNELNELSKKNVEVDEYLKKMEYYFKEKARLAAIVEEAERIRVERICAKKRAKWLPHYAACRIQRYWKRFKIDKSGGTNEKGKGKKGGDKDKKGGKKGGKKK